MAARGVRWWVWLRRWTATAVVLAVTAVAVALIYQYYVTAPWTRDGRVRVLVASVAPQVSGQIVELRVVDNQIVHKGDVLYVIDPFDFRISVDSARAQLQGRAADLQVKQTQAERRNALTSLAASVEEKQQYSGTATMAQASFAAAQVQLAQAEVNLKRTEVRSPVNGYVTNLTLRVGDYASTSSPNIAVIDSDSFWIDGYFEETKLGRICVGDPVVAELMGYSRPVLGRVESFGRGISVSDATSSTQGLPNVNPVYTWVRLAQRVPIRVRIESVPPGVLLASGLTVTVRVRTPGDDDTSLHARLAAAKADVLALFHLGPSLDRPCALPENGSEGVVTKLPIDEAQHPLSPDQINPGLAPAMDAAPKSNPTLAQDRIPRDLRIAK
ncbi:RND family efflux transporter, MFP subunit [Beijerinckiaceae bacterium RH AL1]|nr:HlyD family secretion protein [Beijerinckiaceae bacterium]VVB42842.1 RND family efflux transporter, MFP subunit [Beijerinckiaceae bacterium RH AL8]VVB42853.1 RND family efflux transporter, MFP subunit [Beijerinckiaceae bacterium RH CH11]VVC53535.1 RND family efflux transporter, MFP subunit [Beijerinckiaceae bacterium RH AL1]